MDKLRESLVKTINESHLPIDAIFYVVKDVWRDLVEMHNDALKNNEGTINPDIEKFAAEDIEVVD